MNRSCAGYEPGLAAAALHALKPVEEAAVRQMWPAVPAARATLLSSRSAQPCWVP
jgi:hypothetical protein